jgi:GTPase SAR1 family protein
VGTEDIPHVLVGNKSDLVHEREVATEEGQRLADEWGVPFLESSAKFNMNVEEVFKRLIAQTEAGQDNGKGDKNCTVS